MIFLGYFFSCKCCKHSAKLLFTLVKFLLYLLIAAIALCLFVLTAAVHFGIAVSTGCICLTLMPPICLFKWFKGRNLKARKDKKELYDSGVIIESERKRLETMETERREAMLRELEALETERL